MSIKLNKKGFLEKNNLSYKVDKGILSAIVLLTQLGLTMALSILLWVLVFFYLKRTYQLHDFFLIIGAILGIITGFIADYRIIMQYFKKEDLNK
ncbi:MAG TPA: AtpZ/AtpI family protein [Candidatus Cloacimonadota bacterium]|nr:AtpZ/AtpI family protein [Candidatus Cloacimonadota bacterium]